MAAQPVPGLGTAGAVVLGGALAAAAGAKVLKGKQGASDKNSSDGDGKNG
jgi:hypothetical protein